MADRARAAGCGEQGGRGRELAFCTPALAASPPWEEGGVP